MKVNLLPKEMQPTHNKRTRLVVVSLLSVAVIAAASYYGFALHSTLVSLQNEEAALKTRLVELEPIAVLLSEKARLNNELAALEETLGTQGGMLPTVYLSEVARLVPDQVVLSELSIDKDRLYFRGTTPSYATAALLMEYIAGSDLLAEPMIVYLSSEQSGYRFELTAQIRQEAAANE